MDQTFLFSSLIGTSLFQLFTRYPRPKLDHWFCEFLKTGIIRVPLWRLCPQLLPGTNACTLAILWGGKIFPRTKENCDLGCPLMCSDIFCIPLEHKSHCAAKSCAFIGYWKHQTATLQHANHFVITFGDGGCSMTLYPEVLRPVGMLYQFWYRRLVHNMNTERAQRYLEYSTSCLCIQYICTAGAAAWTFFTQSCLCPSAYSVYVSKCSVCEIIYRCAYSCLKYLQHAANTLDTYTARACCACLKLSHSNIRHLACTVAKTCTT